ncbi:hypothetical protein ACO22_04944 [Paracoccidioides brasiliensis]|uniref:Uncharacterized protein n=1 Tax=Paracoccidioides brasiliensis TaxID=121759 RepID=A0A1D2JBN4_PARBR|nr:hypothetical protein ACO22_04944 [Paracoccidioides brasiliensis]
MAPSGGIARFSVSIPPARTALPHLGELPTIRISVIAKKHPDAESQYREFLRVHQNHSVQERSKFFASFQRLGRLSSVVDLLE